MEFSNRTVEPCNGLLNRETGFEANKSELRPEIRREQEEIQRRIQEARISDSIRHKDIASELSLLSESADKLENSEDIKMKIALLERRLSEDMNRVKDTMKNESVKKKKKLRRMRARKSKGPIFFSVNYVIYN